MEGIFILDVDSLCRLADELEEYFSYCAALSEYMENLTKHNKQITMVIEDIPVPMYVLQKLAYKQDAIANLGGVETNKLVSLVADVACLYGMLPRADEIHSTSIQPPLKGLNDEKVAALKDTTDQLLKVIDSHTNVIADLQQQQQVCLELSAKVEKKQRLVEAFEKKHAAALGGNTQKLRGKLLLLADDVWDTRDDLTKNQISYCEMVDRESNVKDGMLQISGRIQQYIHTFLVRRIAACIGNAHKFLQSTYKFQEAHVFNKRHLSVIHTISAMRKGDVADELIAQSSRIYTFPNTKDYPVYMKGTPKLPEVKLYGIGRSCVHTHSKTVVGSLRLSENLNGYRLKISGRTDAALPNPGFFHLKTDHHVKCKLGMFNGDVGFGWTRKTNYSREKTWGFFMRPPALTDFTEHMPTDSSPQDTIPTALVNLKILKIPETNI